MLEQIGRAHEGIARDLAAQGQLRLFARGSGQRQKSLGGAGKVIEDTLDMLDHLARGGQATGAQFPLGLPIHHGQCAGHW
ncbi:hypothetical protein D3C81_384100 [compost metagenome]